MGRWATGLINSGGQQLLNLVLAGQCPLCQRSSATVPCPSCRRRVGQCKILRGCDRRQPGLPVVAWGRYEDSLRQLIGSLKYDGHTALAEFLGGELGQTWRSQVAHRGRSPRPLAIVPIPLHASKQQQRGFNQAELIARWFCRHTRLPLYSHGLQRVQATQPQHSLSPCDRQRNLAQAFAVPPDQISSLRQTTVWLVDDIFTTGATARAAAHTLRRSGIAVGGICVVARTTPWADTPAAAAIKTIC